jgi:hypothetical protein
MKDKESMLAALTQNMPAEIIEVQPERDVTPSDNELVKDSEDDYALTRKNIHKLLTSSDEAIARMLAVAEESEHPRAFEVLAGMIKTASDVNKQLIDLQKERKKLIKGDLKQTPQPPVGTTNNTIFVGTTTELQKFLNSRESAPLIDV